MEESTVLIIPISSWRQAVKLLKSLSRPPFREDSANKRYRGHPKKTAQGSHLKWAASYANVGCNIMKTTIEIADDLFESAQRLASKEKTTFRSLTEQGLRLVLKA
jgi:hypothetical protein